MGKLFSKKKTPKFESQKKGFDSLDQNHHTQNRQGNMDRYGSSQGQALDSASLMIHTEPVASLATIQPGLCLSGSKDKTIALYDYHNHKLLDRWTGHDRDVTKVCYGASCNGIFSASRDKTVRLWHRGTPQCVREYAGHDLVVSAIHVNKDNTLLCSGSRDNTVKLWSIETGDCIRENRTSRNLVTDVKFVPESHLLVQTGEDKEVRLFDTRSMTISHNFPRKQYIQMSCDVSQDGNYCLTCSNGFGGNGCEATLWDLRTLSVVHEYKGHTEAIEACIFLPTYRNDGRNLLATCSRDTSVRVWDRETKAEVAQCIISCSGPLTSLIAYDDCSICVSSFNEGILQLSFSPASHSLTQRLKF